MKTSFNKIVFEIHMHLTIFRNWITIWLFQTNVYIVSGLLECLVIEAYEPSEWRLFIDSCKRSLKCVLLHNGNEYSAVPLAHSTTMKEKYEEYSREDKILWTQLKNMRWLQNGEFPIGSTVWIPIRSIHVSFACGIVGIKKITTSREIIP